MELMVMTTPDKFRSEIYIVIKLFENGLNTLHLKKPKFSKSHFKNYINQIPKEYHNRIIIHQFFSLVYKYELKGFNSSKKNKPSRIFISFTKKFKKKIVSTISCHSISQLKSLKISNYDFILAGPLYKNAEELKTLNSKFNDDKIKEIIFSYPKKIAFYGGISAENLISLKNNHLYGLIIQGAIWYSKNQQPLDVFLEYNKRLNNNSLHAEKNN